MSKVAIKRAFGSYFYEENGGLFATRSVGKYSDADGTLVNLEGKRVFMQSECKSGDRLRIGLLKQCSGKDTVSARALYKDVGSFKCKAIFSFYSSTSPDVTKPTPMGFGGELRLFLIYLVLSLLVFTM